MRQLTLITTRTMSTNIKCGTPGDLNLYSAWSRGLLEGERCARQRQPCVNTCLRPGAAPTESQQLAQAREWERGYWEGFAGWRRERNSIKPILDAARRRGFKDGRSGVSDAADYLAELKAKDGLSEESLYPNESEIYDAWYEGHEVAALTAEDCNKDSRFWMGAVAATLGALLAKCFF